MRNANLLASLLLATCATLSPPARAQTECKGLKVATGQPSKGFSKLFRDMVKVCGSEVALCEVVTSGGADNLESLSLKEADLGFAQIDSAMTMKNGNEKIAALESVAGLNFSYLHIVVAVQNVTSSAPRTGWLGLGGSKPLVVQHFSDLKGQKVALVGSAQLLARQLEKQLSYGLDFVDVDTDAKALDMVKSGEVAAAFSVAGWPHGVIAPLKQDSGLSLVSFDAPVFHPYVVRPISYRGLGVYNNNALAIPNLLLTRPFKGERAKEIARLQNCLGAKLQELQEGQFQPGWNEIKKLDESFDWPKFHGHLAQTDERAKN
jgi:TRAP-type uncharacterized transport system substrate-binding protein